MSDRSVSRLKGTAGKLGLSAGDVAALLEKYGAIGLKVVIKLLRKGFDTETAIEILRLLYEFIRG